MTSKKLVRYIGASLTNDTMVQAEQFEEIRESVSTFAQTVEVLVKDRNFAGLKTVVLEFIEKQDGIGSHEDGGGTGLLGDSDVLGVAASYLVRRGKSFDEVVKLMETSYRQAQGTSFPSTTEYVRLSELR